MNEEKEKFQLVEWTDFSLCTGIIDHDMMYCFYTECNLEKKSLSSFLLQQLVKKMSSDKDFDVIRNVANANFQYWVPENRRFTHHNGSMNGKYMEAHFYLYCNTDDSINQHEVMKRINKILSDWDTTCAWHPTTIFKLGEAGPWSNHVLCLEFVFRSVDFSVFLYLEMENYMKIFDELTRTSKITYTFTGRYKTLLI